MSRKKTTEEYIADASRVHNGKYDYSKTVYKTSHDKVTITCPKHGDFEVTAYVHLNGSGCPLCAKKLPNNCGNDLFIKKCNFVHKGRYDYSVTEYIDSRHPVKIICKEHGVFEQMPSDHITGHGCPSCAGLKRHTVESFISKAIEVHGDKYDYSLVNSYKTNTDMVSVICPIHGKFTQTAHSHLMGRGCPKCKQSHGEREVSDWLKSHNIEFEQEYRFKDCKDKYPLPFDFYLPKLNTCIEYQGSQHYITKKNWWAESLNYVQLHDAIKAKYCEEHGIRLITIKYTKKVNKALNEALLKGVS